MSRGPEVRARAARVVLAVIHGQALDEALRGAAVRGLEGRDRALLQELVYGVVRWQRLLDAECHHYLNDAGAHLDEQVHYLLLVGLYQLRFLRIAPHAAVTETVSAADGLKRPWARSLVNAILRRSLREPWDASGLSVGLRESHPDWLVARLQDDWGGKAAAILSANNEIAPMTLRINRAVTDRTALLKRLAEAGIEAAPSSEVATAVSVASRPVTTIPGFAEGEVSVQDAAAQWIGTLLALSPGQDVLDACAAPGGKTALIAESGAPARLVAVETNPARVPLIRDTLVRVGLAPRVEIICADAADPGWRGSQDFDRILIDAPCSGTGVIRRHPDIKWLRREDDLARLTAMQSRLLRGLWPALRPGGVLLYVTCSVLKCENDAVVSRFLAETSDASEWPFELSAGQRGAVGWQILPGEAGMDGFYYARLRKAGP